MSIRKIAQRVAALFGAEVETVAWPEMAKRMESGDTVFDSSKLESILPYTYRHRFDDWLENEAITHA